MNAFPKSAAEVSASKAVGDKVKNAMCGRCVPPRNVFMATVQMNIWMEETPTGPLKEEIREQQIPQLTQEYSKILLKTETTISPYSI